MTNCKTITLCQQLVALLVWTMWLPATVQAAVGFTMTPASVAADYAGTITLNITGAASGQTVVVETFVDTNGTGGELLVQSFQVTDGYALTIGGKRYSSVPGDEDGVSNGNILIRLNFQGLSEVAKGIGSFIYRISPASGGFAPVVFPFSVTQLAQAQKIVGQVTSGLAPVPFAYVFLITPTSDGPLVGSIADAGGNFTLHAAEGTYTVGALQSGVLLDFNAAPQVTLSAGATVPQNLSLGAPNRTIAGRLTDAASGVGLAGVLMTAEIGELGLLGLGFSDANGNFAIAVSDAAAQWVLYPSEKSAALLGYLLATDGYQVDIAGGSVSDVAIQLPKAAALIWGTLTVDQGPPLAGVSICADNSGQYESCVVTDSGGNYVAGVVAGTWNIGADRNDLAALGYMGQGAQVTVGAGQALRQDLLARQPTAHLVGRVVDDSSPANAVGNICIFAYPGQGGGVDGQTDADGNFSLGVVAGTWQLSLCDDAVRKRGLVGPRRSFTVTDGVDVTGIQYVAKRVTAHITGHVRDNHNTPVAGVGVDAHIDVGGVSYDAWQQTDASGGFSLGVFDGFWGVNLNCGDLQPRGYRCASAQSVTVAGADRVVNFTVQPACLGDCRGNGQVTVAEILTMVTIAIGNAQVSECYAGDSTHDNQITVEEILAAVHNALHGC